MRIGPDHWMCVSPDTAGAPSGGRWGDPEWFGDRLRRVGLDLVWSKMHACFGIVRQVSPGRMVWQMHCRRGGPGSDPIPLGGELLKWVLTMWNEAKNRSAADIMRRVEQVRREEAAQQAAERRTYAEESMPEVLDYMELARGHRGPRLIVPMSATGKPVGLYRDRKKRKPYRGPAQRGRILLPHEAN